MDSAYELQVEVEALESYIGSLEDTLEEACEILEEFAEGSLNLAMIKYKEYKDI
jgi:hypothetical protein